ncbi:MAG TPA: hypothetical protein VGC80_15455 [Acetobacteraceae bacterium]|jgi:hypothetical protein
MPPPLTRLLLGFLAGALSVLTFHQGMWEFFHLLNLPGLGMPAPYVLRPVPPFGIPQVASAAFWGGLYGAAFGYLSPRFTWPLWLCGLATGIVAVLVGWFIVAPIKGNPVAGGWAPFNWIRPVCINGFWGIGVGVIYGLLRGASSKQAGGLTAETLRR